MEEDLPADYFEPSPGPWAFHTHTYGLNNVILDRLGHHLCSMAPTWTMWRCRAACILQEIESHRPREPGEDDE